MNIGDDDGTLHFSSVVHGHSQPWKDDHLDNDLVCVKLSKFNVMLKCTSFLLLKGLEVKIIVS